MKKSIFAISIFSLLSCEPQGNRAPSKKRLVLDSTSVYADQTYRVYTLEGCEYVAIGVGDRQWGSHKGNCKNPIHTK
jgi:hypothetical protein